MRSVANERVAKSETVVMGWLSCKRKQRRKRRGDHEPVAGDLTELTKTIWLFYET